MNTDNERAILDTLAAHTRALAEIRELLTGARTSSHQRAAGPAAADDATLDSPNGNPVVRWNPPRWSGDSYAGCPMSECPAEYLDVLASFKDFCADKPREGKEQYAPRDRAEAALSRGWAARIRAGGVAAPAPTGRAPHGRLPGSRSGRRRPGHR